MHAFACSAFVLYKNAEEQCCIQTLLVSLSYNLKKIVSLASEPAGDAFECALANVWYLLHFYPAFLPSWNSRKYTQDSQSVSWPITDQIQACLNSTRGSYHVTLDRALGPAEIGQDWIVCRGLCVLIANVLSRHHPCPRSKAERSIPGANSAVRQGEDPGVLTTSHLLRSASEDPDYSPQGPLRLAACFARGVPRRSGWWWGPLNPSLVGHPERFEW